jgi:hypothetical protein
MQQAMAASVALAAALLSAPATGAAKRAAASCFAPPSEGGPR